MSLLGDASDEAVGKRVRGIRELLRDDHGKPISREAFVARINGAMRDHDLSRVEGGRRPLKPPEAEAIKAIDPLDRGLQWLLTGVQSTQAEGLDGLESRLAAMERLANGGADPVVLERLMREFFEAAEAAIPGLVGKPEFPRMVAGILLRSKGLVRNAESGRVAPQADVKGS